MRLLPDLARWGDRTAVVEPDVRSVTYAELDARASLVAANLKAAGIQPGDRVGLYSPRTADVVAAMIGALRVGAAYVPVDPSAPPARNATIHTNCGVRLTLAEPRYVKAFATETAALGAEIPTAGLDAALPTGPLRPSTPPAVPLQPGDQLAYILNTSGSTGTPKGIAITDDNAAVFVEWCREILHPTPDDRFANHAQFHFDISVLDIYTALHSGAALVIVSDAIGRSASHAAQLLSKERITVWYSAPSILAQMAQLNVLPTLDLSALRVIAFAGEVFPLAHLKELRRQVPAPRFLNLYGPTETNVCTWYELPPSIEAAEKPMPIGKACSHYEGRIVDEHGVDVAKGAEGELVMRSRGVMAGYWGRPDLTAEKTFRATDGGLDWYRTGDVVIEEPDGNITYMSRRDRMVKRRGYRVELGEIEARLYQHPDVKEAAVIAVPADDSVNLHAHLSTKSGEKLSTLQLKTFCGQKLPAYMVPDVFVFHQALPRTSTEKVDYQRLKAPSP